jgi:hypothetical protein
MVWNLLRLFLVFWVLRLIYRWYRAYVELERRRAYDQGAQKNQSSKPNQKLDDDRVGDYIDYEELKP